MVNIFVTGKPMQERHFLSPQPFKPCRVGCFVHDGVLNVPVAKIVLNEARVCPLIGQGEAASVAEHVRQDGKIFPFLPLYHEFYR
jgi:hypothetical protein